MIDIDIDIDRSFGSSSIVGGGGGGGGGGAAAAAAAAAAGRSPPSPSRNILLASPTTPRALPSAAPQTPRMPTSRSLSVVHHARIDSLPPQRYALNPHSAVASTSSFSIDLNNTNNNDDDGEDEQQQQEQSTDDLEDITLEEVPEQHSAPVPRSAEVIRKDHVSSHDYHKRTQQDLPPLPPPAPPERSLTPTSSSSTTDADRTATQSVDSDSHHESIRRLSSSSSSRKGVSPPSAPTHRPHALRSQTDVDSPASTTLSLGSPRLNRPMSSISISSQYSASAFPPSSSRAGRRYSHHQGTSSRSTTPGEKERRLVEGRYRGRISRPTSRAASPDRDFSIKYSPGIGRSPFSMCGFGSSSSRTASPTASAFELARPERQTIIVEPPALPEKHPGRGRLANAEAALGLEVETEATGSSEAEAAVESGLVASGLEHEDRVLPLRSELSAPDDSLEASEQGAEVEEEQSTPVADPARPNGEQIGPNDPGEVEMDPINLSESQTEPTKPPEETSRMDVVFDADADVDEEVEDVGRPSGSNSVRSRPSPTAKAEPLPEKSHEGADTSSVDKPAVRASTSSRRSSSAATTKTDGGAAAPPSAPSLTRLSTLPPKAIAEEKAHQALHQDMLVSFRALQAKRDAELAARRKIKEDEWDFVTPIWERDILPSWTRARRDERLHDLWWRGAPPNLRGRVWALVCGNALMLPRNLWTGLSKAVDAALVAVENDQQPEGVWRIPPAVLHIIDEDIEDALPSLKLFQRNSGPMWTDLRAFMCGLVLLRLEKLGLAPPKPQANDATHVRNTSLSGALPVKVLTPDDIEPELLYQPGLAQLGAMLLCNLSPSEALIAMVNLLAQRHWLRVLFGPSPGVGGLAPPTPSPASSAVHPDQQRATVIESALAELKEAKVQLGRELDGMERVFDTLLADQMPKVFANMQARGVKPRMYLRNWLRSLFASWLPFDSVARLWDVILLDETDATVYRTALALVQLLESRLYVPDAEELVTVLNGRNRVILEVWHRQLSGPLGSARDCEAARLSVGRNWVEPEDKDAGLPATNDDVEAAGTQDTAKADDEENGSSHAADDRPTPPAKPNGSHAPTRRAVEADRSMIPLDNIFAQYGITEDILFKTIEAQYGWWKNSTLARLLDRELGM